ncbi:MAG: hypothetical protein HWE11_07810 [Gammaproteobacteria bacterium]|nr:hypothetical protein [Gammaproteobacteria bacterium]
MCNRYFALAMACCFVALMTSSSTFAADAKGLAADHSSGWRSYFLNTEQLTPQSIALSQRFGRAIVVLSAEQSRNVALREALLHSMVLPVQRETDQWWQRYQQGLILESRQGGYTLKQPDNLTLPCIVSVGSGYHSHVDRGGLFNQMTRYNYHPFSNREEAYQTMVLWHEVGHCFETYGGVEGEVYADLFAILAHKSSIHRQTALQHQVEMRRQEFFDGDELHYTAEQLMQLAALIDHAGDTERQQPQFVHWLMAVIMLPDGAVNAPSGTAELARNRLAIKYTEQLLAQLKPPLSDRQEQAYWQLTAMKNSFQQALAATAKPQRHQARIQLKFRALVADMYRIRMRRDDLYNDLQWNEFREDVEFIASAMGLSPSHSANDDNQSWLKAWTTPD